MTAEQERRQEADPKADNVKKHGSHGNKQLSERRARNPNQDKIERADLDGVCSAGMFGHHTTEGERRSSGVANSDRQSQIR